MTMRTLRIPGASCSNVLATHIGTPIVAVKTTRGYAGNYSVSKSTSYTVWLVPATIVHITWSYIHIDISQSFWLQRKTCANGLKFRRR